MPDDPVISIPEAWKDPAKTPLDFIIVGAGAAGAPLAARLVERGFTVLVMEMGPRGMDGTSERVGAEVENTDVPLLHPETTEDPRHSLRFFVKHFDRDPEESLDPKIHRPQPMPGAPTPNPGDEHGIFYPRAQGIGGCTIHNAMITVCGPSEDWDEIAEATGDESWRGERMRAYFERLEKCHYARPATPWTSLKGWLGFRTGWEDARHGDRGWLDTTMADLRFLVKEKRFLRVVLEAAMVSFEAGIERIGQLLWVAFKGRAFPEFDPNHWETMRHSLEGLSQIPCAITPTGERSTPRQRLLDTKRNSIHANRLHILTGACVTEVVLQKDANADQVGGIETKHRATGVRCLPREHVYEADTKVEGLENGWSEHLVTLHCKAEGEVILCGGAFNTPQLLMLSGIGPAAHLKEHEITPRVPLAGVGSNLQDRYEVPVIATITDRFRSLDGLALASHGPDARSDSRLAQWRSGRGRPARKRGLYATNGGLIAIFKRSAQEDSVPDLFIFALAGNFPGYSVGWSKPSALAPGQSRSTDPEAAADHKRTLTWLLLKARTRHHGGEVRLRDSHPFRRPEINFRSFPDAPDDDALENKDKDLEAVYEGVNLVKRILGTGIEKGSVERFELPGLGDFQDDVRKWIKHIAWGHHACGTCRIGGDNDELAVLDSRFRVRGVQGLRVVDASIFPRIPGYFIVTNVYMIAEKAADVLAEDHATGEEPADDVKKALERDRVLKSRPELEARRLFPIEMEQVEARLISERRSTADI